MFCENCGNKIDSGHKFCTKCGKPTSLPKSKAESVKSYIPLGDSWWHRLLKVAYIFMNLQILWIVPAVWSTNSSGYDIYSRKYEDTYGEAFWYSLLALAICVAIIRLIKITTLYVAFGVKPEWREEFRKPF